MAYLLKNPNAALAYTGICGIAPVYATVSAAVGIGTFILPSRVWWTLDGFLYYSFQEFMRLYFELYPRTKFIFHGDRPRDENCVYISNHQSNMDWFLPVILSSDFSGAGRVRYVLKDTLRLLPLFGWNFAMHGCIYVAKGGGFNQDRFNSSLTALKHLITPNWLVIFPEGTRHEPEALLSSSQSESDLVMVKSPRKKAFVTSVQQLGDSISAVYDVTVAYNVGSGQRARPEHCTMEAMMRGAFKEVHVHLNRVPIKTFPKDSDDQSEWLADAFTQKDLMLQRFYDGDNFPGEEWTNESSVGNTVACAVFWNTLLALSFGTEMGRKIYFSQLVAGSIGGMIVGGYLIWYQRRRDPKKF